MREAGAGLVLWAARAATSPAGGPEAVPSVQECESCSLEKSNYSIDGSHEARSLPSWLPAACVNLHLV